MTQEEYVSFDVAKLLYEKGFEIDTDKNYWKIGEDGTRYFISSIGAYTSDINNKYAFYIPANSYPCPTQQMAMRWLREKYNIHIIIEPTTAWFGMAMDGEYKKVFEPRIEEWEFNPPRGHGFPDKKFCGYEEAAEAAIKHCLENLI